MIEKVRAGGSPPRTWRDDSFWNPAWTVFRVVFILFHVLLTLAILHSLVNTSRTIASARQRQHRNTQSKPTSTAHMFFLNITCRSINLKALILICLLVSSVSRVVWVVDGFGLERLYGKVLRSLLVEISHDALAVAILLLAASWKRMVAARLSRIKSAITIGRYKYPVLTLVGLLFVVTLLGVLAAFGVAEEEITLTARILFAMYGFGVFIAGVLYGWRFSELLAQSNRGADSGTAAASRMSALRFRVLRALFIWSVLAFLWCVAFSVGTAAGPLKPEFFLLYEASIRLAELCFASMILITLGGTTRMCRDLQRILCCCCSSTGSRRPEGNPKAVKTPRSAASSPGVTTVVHPKDTREGEKRVRHVRLVEAKDSETAGDANMVSGSACVVVVAKPLRSESPSGRSDSAKEADVGHPQQHTEDSEGERRLGKEEEGGDIADDDDGGGVADEEDDEDDVEIDDETDDSELRWLKDILCCRSCRRQGIPPLLTSSSPRSSPSAQRSPASGLSTSPLQVGHLRRPRRLSRPRHSLQVRRKSYHPSDATQDAPVGGCSSHTLDGLVTPPRSRATPKRHQHQHHVRVKLGPVVPSSSLSTPSDSPSQPSHLTTPAVPIVVTTSGFTVTRNPMNRHLPSP